MDRQKSLKFPVCSLCSQSFALRSNQKPGCGPRSPLILKCGHTACEGCIVRSIADHQKVTCSCQEVSVPSKNYSEKNVRQEFPLDYYTIGVYVVISNNVTSDVQIGFITTNRQQNRAKQTMTVSCHECRKVDADCTCVQCDAPYCTSCFNAIHQLARAFREHKTVALRCGATELGSRDIHCLVHRLHFEFFCNDCSASICSRCLLSDHKGHNIDLLADKNKTAMEELIDLHIKVVNHQKRLKSTRKKVAQALSRGAMSGHVAQLEKTVIEHFSWLHGYLLYKQHQIITDIYTPYESWHKQIKTLLDTLDQYSTDVDAVLSVSDRLVKASPKYDASVNYMDVISVLKEKADLPCFFVSETVQENFRFIADQSIFQSIDDHCHLEKSEVDDASGCRLVRASELPEGYEIESIPEVTKDNLTLQVEELQRTRTNSSTSLSSHGSIDGQSTQLHEFTEGGACPVSLCHITSPSDFYVHRPGVARILSNLQAQFSRLGSLKKHPPIDVIKGRIYLVKYGQDNKWYRGRVMNIGGIDEIEIFYIDYGNSEVVSKDRLRTIPVDLMGVGSLATHCRMYNCVPATGSIWSTDAVSLMAQWSKNGDISIVVKKIQQDIIDVDILQHVNNGVMSLQESLLFLGLAVLAESCDIVLSNAKPVKSFPLQLPWHEGETVQARVIYIESLSNFFVFDMQAAYKTYLKMKEDLMKFYNSHLDNKKLQVYNPQPGMPVAVKCGSNDWFRAQIVEVPAAKMVKVLLIDSGNEEVISWNKMMGLVPKFLRYPPLAKKCMLSHIIPLQGDTWSQDAIKVFKVATSGINLKIVVNSIENDTSVVTVYTNRLGENKCINALLIHEGLAKSSDSNAPFGDLHSEVQSSNSTEDVEVLSSMLANAQLEGTSFEHAAASFSASQNVPDGPNPHFDNNNDTVRMKVVVKRIVSPDQFYVAPTWMAEKLTLMKRKLADFCKKKSKSVENVEWKVDNICVVNVAVGNQAWHRAVIQEKLKDPPRFKVNLLDEGMEETVPSDKVFPLDRQFKKLIEGVIRCRLGGIQSPMHPSPWPYSSIAEMKHLTANNSSDLFMTQMGNIKDRSLPVELFIRKTIPAGPLEPTRCEWDSINNRLRICGLASDDGTKNWSIDEYLSTSCETLNSSEPFQIPNDEEVESEVINPDDFKELMDSLPTEWLPPDPFTNLEFLANPTYVDHNASVYIQDFQKSVMKLKAITEELNKVYEGSEPRPYDKFWSVGQICVARYHLDGKWYRGIVEEIRKKDIMVKFVDYGNVEDCALSDMRKIPLMVDVPIQCQPCYFYNILPATPNEKWTTDLLDYLHTSLVEKRCQVTLCILSNEEGDRYGISSMRMCTGKDFIMQMVEEGQFKYNGEIFTNSRVGEGTSEDEVDEAEATKECGGLQAAEVTGGEVEIITSEEIIIESDEIYVNSDQAKEDGLGDLEKTLYWVDLIEPNSEAPIANYKHVIIPQDMDTLEVEMAAVLSVTQILVNITDSGNASLNLMKEKFLDLMKKMQDEAPDQPKLDPPYLYQACCVKFTEDDQWYRGIVLQVLPEDRLLIQYVDYGNAEIIPADQVHRLKEEWTLVEVQAVLVVLNGVKPSQSCDRVKCAEILSSHLQSHPLVAHLKARRESRVVAELYIDDKLAYQQLIDDEFMELSS